MPERRKRTYTFRKDQFVPFESGSFMHEEVKAQRQAARNFEELSQPRKRRSQSFF
jgi:hypothetical protein